MDLLLGSAGDVKPSQRVDPGFGPLVTPAITNSKAATSWVRELVELATVDAYPQG
jgi:hypothetical protein